MILFSDQEIEYALNYLKRDVFKKIYGADKPNKSSFVVLFCRSGSRAKKAMTKLKDCGFEKLIQAYYLKKARLYLK